VNSTEANADPTSETSPSRPRPRIPRRIRIAEWLAFAGLVAACLASIGPAEKLRTTYSWPPAALPSGTPEREWYTPLLLAAQVPERLSVDVPCQPAPALRDASDPVTVLATSRSPDRDQRFVITRSDNDLTYRVGDTLLARVPVERAPPADCLYRITLEDGRWSLSGGAEDVELGGDIGYMPVVSGLVSELDLRAGPAPSAAVTTGVHATGTTTWQAIGWTTAALASIVALLLVAFPRVPRKPWRTLWTALLAAFRGIRAVDAVVGVSLLAWWVLSPAFYDDGWTIARQKVFATSRGFSTYYNGLGTNLPNDYWLDWLQHWITQSFDTLLILRIPTLLCLGGVWALCRWTLSRVVQDGTSTRGLPEWVLAGAFLTGAMAWGMTLRPEPIIAVLVTATLVCAVWFSEGGGPRPLALLAVLVPLAATGHHAGVVALASLAVIAGPVVRWARTELAAAVAIVTSAFALLVTLAFVGSDIAQRANDAQATRLYSGVTDTWRDEAARYEYLSVGVTASPLRRGWVALIGLAVLAFVLRRRRGRTSLDLASASLGVALILLIATPSKWPWHFGALVGIAAVAVASETIRLCRDAADARGWSARPFIVIGAALLALVWAAGLREPWNPHDLRSLDWTLSSSWFQAESIALGFGFLFAGAIVVTRRSARPLAHAPWTLATKAALVITLPLIAFTIGMLTVDAFKTDGWTLTRQNLRSLRGDPGCGLGDDLIAPAMTSVHPISIVGTDRRLVPAWLPPSPVDGLDRLALGPAPGGPVKSPWYALAADDKIGIFISGPPGSASALSFEWGENRRGAIESIGRESIPTDTGPRDEHAMPWRFLLSSELPRAPSEADAVRVVFENRISRGSAVGVSAPVTYAGETLTEQLGDRASASLVHPILRTYFPCARQPVIRDGVAEAPDLIVTRTDTPNPAISFSPASPFMGLLDLYTLQRLSLADSDNPPDGSIAFSVDKRIDGAIEAPPDAVTAAS
jgi:hypothetical protein